MTVPRFSIRTDAPTSERMARIRQRDTVMPGLVIIAGDTNPVRCPAAVVLPTRPSRVAHSRTVTGDAAT